MKPKEGDIVRVLDPEASLGDPQGQIEWRVIQVHDSLDESWDPFGESAWSQRDHDTGMNAFGEWYVIVENPAYQGESMSLASYECEVVPK